MIEIWKDVKGYEGRYTVSNLGQVKSFLTLKISGLLLNRNLDTAGYPIVKRYSGNDKGKTKKVHRLVAEAFIPNPNSLPQVNHLDGVKDNNCVANLEWCDGFGNQRHAWNIGLCKKRFGEDCNVSKATEKIILEIREKAGRVLMKDMAKEYGMSKTNVSDIIKRRTWKHI